MLSEVEGLVASDMIADGKKQLNFSWARRGEAIKSVIENDGTIALLLRTLGHGKGDRDELNLNGKRDLDLSWAHNLKFKFIRILQNSPNTFFLLATEPSILCFIAHQQLFATHSLHREFQQNLLN